MGCGSTNMDDLRSGVNFLSSLPLSISILAQGLENGMIMLLRQAEIFCQQYKRIFSSLYQVRLTLRNSAYFVTQRSLIGKCCF